MDETFRALLNALPPHGSPGRFEGEPALSRVVHLLSMDGADEETGDSVTGDGWYGLLRGRIDEHAFEDAGYRPDETERRFNEALGGMIVHEDPQGFVEVTYYGKDDAAAMEADWGRVTREAGMDSGLL